MIVTTCTDVVVVDNGYCGREMKGVLVLPNVQEPCAAGRAVSVRGKPGSNGGFLSQAFPCARWWWWGGEGGYDEERLVKRPMLRT